MKHKLTTDTAFFTGIHLVALVQRKRENYMQCPDMSSLSLWYQSSWNKCMLTFLWWSL